MTLTTKPTKPCLTKTNSQEKGHSVRSMCAQTSPESITLNTRKSLKCKDLTHFLSLDELQLTSKITSTNAMNLIKTLLRKKKNCSYLNYIISTEPIQVKIILSCVSSQLDLFLVAGVFPSTSSKFAGLSLIAMSHRTEETSTWSHYKHRNNRGYPRIHFCSLSRSWSQRQQPEQSCKDLPLTCHHL